MPISNTFNHVNIQKTAWTTKNTMAFLLEAMLKRKLKLDLKCSLVLLLLCTVVKYISGLPMWSKYRGSIPAAVTLWPVELQPQWPTSKLVADYTASHATHTFPRYMNTVHLTFVACRNTISDSLADTHTHTLKKKDNGRVVLQSISLD